jgi:lipopolysaccharide/colanic/teichoic acid biosynthesis glycosyltransferase
MKQPSQIESRLARRGEIAAHVQDEALAQALAQAADVTLYMVAKRLTDIVVAAVGLVVCAPLFALIALAIKIDSPGPVFFRQVRVGRDRRLKSLPLLRFENVVRMDVRRDDFFGEPFTMVKFRTMRADAEARSGAVWAQAGDPRVTSVGRFLRDTRLDELPQLWNVLRGEMTLIGPRPERPEFVQNFVNLIEGYEQRHFVTPGITGLSQVRQGYDKCLDDVRRKLHHDLEYIRNRTLLLDVAIAMQTIGVMVGHFGAH